MTLPKGKKRAAPGTKSAASRRIAGAASPRSVANVSSAVVGIGAAPKMGRPTKLSAEVIEQVRKLCQLGSTEAELAFFFEVSLQTIRNWRATNSDFATAMALGKQHSDARVERSLFARAVGFEHPAVKVFLDPRTGRTVEHHYTEVYPPDTRACEFWLKNRLPDLWKDKFEMPAVPPEEAATIAQEAVAKAMATSVREAAGVPAGEKVKAG